MLTELHDKILHDIFSNSKNKEITTFDDLYLNYGLDEHTIRPLIEDLKESGYIVEFEACFEITKSGENFATRKWA